MQFLIWKFMNYIHFGLTFVLAVYSILDPQKVLQIFRTDPIYMSQFTEFQRAYIGVVSLQLAGLYLIMAMEEEPGKIQKFARVILVTILVGISWYISAFSNDTLGITYSMKNTVFSWGVYAFVYVYFSIVKLEDKEKEE